MKNFIKVTGKEDTTVGVVWVSKYQIVYLEADEDHSQTFIYCSGGREFKVAESVSEILKQLGE